MFYIEKNDKPNFMERKFNILKIVDNTIMIPIYKNIVEKQIEKIAMKTNKFILKNSSSKKIVLSKEMKEQEIYVNFLNTYGFEIQNGRWLFEVLLLDVTKYIVEKKSIEKVNVSILINDLTDVEIDNIYALARKYNFLNIVTNHIEKFQKIKDDLYENEGIIITITNNKKKSLIKSNVVLNIDFPNELINKYNMKDDAIVVNVRGKVKINKKRFNGLNVSGYEIDFREDKKYGQAINSHYCLKDIYEAELYRKQSIKNVKEQIRLDKVKIKYLILNNGVL